MGTRRLYNSGGRNLIPQSVTTKRYGNQGDKYGREEGVKISGYA